MKKIVTHLSPHLDEIFAIWLLKRYDPTCSELTVDFKATNPQGGEVPLDLVDKDPDTIYLGLGRGKYDEHALGKEEAANASAASLVWDDLKGRGFAPKDQTELAAVEKMLEFIQKDDHGELKSESHYLADFSITALWDGFAKVHRSDSEKKLEFGLPLMDYMYAYLAGIAGATGAVESGEPFETPWGKGIGIIADFKETSMVAYRQGYVLAIVIQPKMGYRLIMGDAKSTVDLTEAYQKLKEIDPSADWYLHQSKRMLLSGSHSAPNVKVSSLPMEKLIEVVKS